MRDEETLNVYAKRAQAYAEMVDDNAVNRPLDVFLADIPKGGHILDWGCGVGNSSALILAKGYRVTATDASDAFAEIAKENYNIDVRVEAFHDLQEVEVFDGIWANFSLLHAPKSDMPQHLARAKKALKSNGRLYLGLKTGEGERRDEIGRFYAYYNQEEITDLLNAAGFTLAHRETGEEQGLDGKMWPFQLLYAHA